MKCRRCAGVALVEVRRHHAAFCADCFQHHCREQVRRAVDHFEMMRSGDKILVAVSGGKDSLAAWDLLLDLGYEADGLYLGLGIDGYSDRSKACTQAYAASRELRLIVVDIPEQHGFGIPAAALATRRSPCGSCGLSKRHLFNRHAMEGGYDVLVTGHNLDDEAAVLLGNVLRWDGAYLGRQYPVLEAAPGFVRKVKPLIRLGEREMAAYCLIRGIDYIVEECPMAGGNRHLAYKETLNRLEERSPGAKASFMFGFLERGHERFAQDAASEREDLVPCSVCGSPTTGETCAFCRLEDRMTAVSPGECA
ncbi:MAG: ATP-binding protein [Acidimicrobiia bacterium]